MGHVMNFWNSVKIGFKKVKSVKNNLIGIAKKYEIDQDDLDFPFEQGYAKSSDVYAIVKKIADNAKTIPWILKKRTKAGSEVVEEVITEGPLYDIIQQPNKEQNRQQYTEQGISQLLLGGNGFLWTPIDEGFEDEPDETYLLHPQLVQIKSVLEDRIIIAEKYIYRIGGKTFPMSTEEITHLKYCNPTEFGITTLRGLSPLTAGALSMIGVNSNQTAQASILENQSTAGLLSNEGDDVLTPTEQTEQQDLLDDKLGDAASFGHILQSSAKIKYIKLGLDSSQMEIIKSKIMMFRDLCNIWDVNSILFGDVVGSTFNNLIEAKKSLITGPVKAALGLLIGAFQLSVVKRFNEKEFPNGEAKYFIEADFSSVEALQKDQKDEAIKDKTVIQGIDLIMKMSITLDSKKSMINEVYDLPSEMVNALKEQPKDNNS